MISHSEIIGIKKASGCVHPEQTLIFFHENKEIAKKEYSNFLMVKAFKEHRYTQTGIGDFLGIHYSTVSKIIDNSKSKT